MSIKGYMRASGHRGSPGQPAGRFADEGDFGGWRGFVEIGASQEIQSSAARWGAKRSPKKGIPSHDGKDVAGGPKDQKKNHSRGGEVIGKFQIFLRGPARSIMEFNNRGRNSKKSSPEKTAYDRRRLKMGRKIFEDNKKTEEGKVKGKPRLKEMKPWAASRSELFEKKNRGQERAVVPGKCECLTGARV